MNREKEWDFIDEEKSLLATVGIVVRELAIKCPNDQELGKSKKKRADSMHSLWAEP